VIQSEAMAEVTIRELRNNGAAVIDRVLAGETLTVTRSGTPVAELRPVARRPLSTAALRQRWAQLPPVDPEALRRDIDALIDMSL